jgi:hypothetical protein
MTGRVTGATRRTGQKKKIRRVDSREWFKGATS